MNKENLEIERKFLLKTVPDFSETVKKLLIHQIYVDGVRYRMTEDEDSSRIYHHCIKKTLEPGVFEELEHEISEKEFKEKLNKDHTYIIKTRYVHEENGLKWEIDKYHDVRLVTLEVELDGIKQKITIPDFIAELIITELTGQKAFSNYNLSIKKDY